MKKLYKLTKDIQYFSSKYPVLYEGAFYLKIAEFEMGIEVTDIKGLVHLIPSEYKNFFEEVKQITYISISEDFGENMAKQLTSLRAHGVELVGNMLVKSDMLIQMVVFHPYEDEEPMLR